MVALDSTSSASGSTTLNWSHVNSGNYLVVFIYTYCPGGVPTGGGGVRISNVATLTYNGVSLSCIKFSTGLGNMVLEAWHLKNPPTGTHNIDFVQSVGDGTQTQISAMSFTGADLVTQPDDFSHVLDGSGSGTSITMSPNATQAGDMTAGFYITDSSSSLSAWAITSGTVVRSVAMSIDANGRFVSGYLNSTSSGAGAQNFVGTWSGGAANFLDSGITITINPNLSTANGLFMFSD